MASVAAIPPPDATPVGHGPSRHWRSRQRVFGVIGLVLVLVSVATGYARYLGYPNGQLLTLVPASAPARADRSGTVAIFLSGDMGFNIGMGPPIARGLADLGISVVGINSLTGFSWRRTPAQTTALVREAALRALGLPGARRLILIGQSFGADALLAGADGLPPALRSRVAMVALIVPGDTYSLRSSPSSLLNIGADGAALPFAARLDWAPLLCVHGSAEQDSLCPLLRQPNVTKAELPGGHLLKHDTALVAATIMHAFDAVARRPAFPSTDRSH